MTEQICRTCLKKTLHFDGLGDGEGSLKFKLVYCIPELDYTVVTSPVMCKQCVRMLNVSFNFIKVCMLTEEKLKEVKGSRKSNADYGGEIEVVDTTTLINGLNQEEVDFVLRACNKPLIIAPDDISIVNGNVLTICNMSELQGKCLPLIADETDSSQLVENNDATQEDDKLSCKICDKQFSREENLRFHEKMHNNSDLLQCNTCGKSFSDPTSLISHIGSHQTEEPPVECELCGRFSHKLCTAEHEGTHRNQTTFHCRFCDQNFCKKGLFLYHLRTHTEKKDDEKNGTCVVCAEHISGRVSIKRKSDVLETPPTLVAEPIVEVKKPRRGRPPKYLAAKTDVPVREMPTLEPEVAQDENAIVISDDDGDESSTNYESSLSFPSFSGCAICLKTFKSNSLLMEHCKQHLELQCVDCGLCFTAINDILQHEELNHDLQCFECKKCDKKVALKSNFIEHVLAHDTTKTLYACKVCYLFVNQNYSKCLARFKLFNGRKTFQCDVCCKILQITNVDSLRCNICFRNFPNESLLARHRDEFTSSNVKCCDCNKFYHTTDDFERHSKTNCVVTHRRHIFSDGSDFNCFKCFEEFPTQQALDKHCVDVRHYKCDNCDTVFGHWNDLNAHMSLYPILLCSDCRSSVLGERCLKEHKIVCSSISSAQSQSPTAFDMSKTLLCIKCNEIYSKKETLIEHLIFVH